jgi:hypothetical protein
MLKGYPPAQKHSSGTWRRWWPLACPITDSGLAAYGHCSEQPDAADCRTYNMPGLPPAKSAQPTVSKPTVHARNHHHMLPQNG